MSTIIGRSDIVWGFVTVSNFSRFHICAITENSPSVINVLSNRPPNARCHMTTIYPNDVGRNRFVLARDRKRRRFQEAFHEFSLTCWKLRDERRGPTTNCAYRSGRVSQETRTNAKLDYGLGPVTLPGCLSGFKVGRQLSRNAKGRAHMLALTQCHCL